MRELLGVTEAEIDAAGMTHTELEALHWVEAAVVLSVGSRGCDAVLPGLMQYHQEVVVAMVGHLRLTAENLMRSLWSSAGILQKDAALAQVSARAFHEHLLGQQPQQRSPYEEHFVNDDMLMLERGQFASADPPVLVWRGNGSVQNLFKFLAARFLSCPDSVLSAESIHARWHWIQAIKRGISLKMLNCFLKLSVHLEQHGGSFLQNGDEAKQLYEHMHFIAAGLRQQMNTLRREGHRCRPGSRPPCGGASADGGEGLVKLC